MPGIRNLFWKFFGITVDNSSKGRYHKRMKTMNEETVGCVCEECGSEFVEAVAATKCDECIEWEAENLCPMCGGDELGSYDCEKYCKECGHYD